MFKRRQTKQKHNTICAGTPPYANTNNVKKTSPSSSCKQRIHYKILYFQFK